jgi:hypothetical protein
MKNSILAFVLGAGALILTGLNASAGLIATVNYGGHTYELWSAPGISWAAAEGLAEKEGNTLAVLTDTAEITSVYALLINNGFFQGGGDGSQAVEAWLGGYTADLSGSTLDPYNWAWATGEAWTTDDALNFHSPPEPNGDSSGLAINRYGTFEYNDESGPVGGYIVERAPDGGTTVALLGMSLTGLAYFRRKLA